MNGKTILPPDFEGRTHFHKVFGEGTWYLDTAFSQVELKCDTAALFEVGPNEKLDALVAAIGELSGAAWEMGISLDSVTFSGLEAKSPDLEDKQGFLR